MFINSYHRKCISSQDERMLILRKVFNWSIKNNLEASLHKRVWGHTNWINGTMEHMPAIQFIRHHHRKWVHFSVESQENQVFLQENLGFHLPVELLSLMRKRREFHCKYKIINKSQLPNANSMSNSLQKSFDLKYKSSIKYSTIMFNLIRPTWQESCIIS